MSNCRKWNSLLGLLVLGGLLLSCSGAFCPLFGDEGLEVKKDKDKTTYSVGSSDEKKDEDKEKAWDMLKNMGIVIDERSSLGKGQNSNR